MTLPALADTPAPASAKLLRCENLVDPLGIEQTQPRLSWQLQSSERGARQTAFRVLVSATAAALAGDRGELWDSGKVETAQTSAIVYAGKALTSNERCYWKVQIFNAAGQPSAWSAPAVFSVGLLEPADWHAEWIGYDKARQVLPAPAPFDGAKWIGFRGDKPLDAPKGFRVFMTRFTIPAGATVQTAELAVSGDDRAWFIINGNQVALTEGFDHPQVLDVGHYVKPGENLVRAQVENTSAGPMGLLAKLVVKTADGNTTTLVTNGAWHATDNPGANWHIRPIDPDAWPAARVLGDYGMKPWGQLQHITEFLPPTSYLRTTFKADKPVRRAMLYATALGLCDLYLNGSRVTEDRFIPGWTDYNKRVYYRAYDVTAHLKPGENALGAELADGWYSGYIGYQHARDHYGKNPRLLVQLLVEYEDGSTAVVATGPQWKAATGPTLHADFLQGEAYDARLALNGWEQPGFDDGKWDAVERGAELKPLVQHHPGPPVRAIGEFRPLKVTEPAPGVYVLDLGQNFAGVARLSVNGKAGQKITLRFAERLNPDGTIYTTNLRTAKSTDTYICRGGGTEVWEPRFTFHGFQYVEVSGLDAPPAPDAVVGIPISSDTPLAGSFECSDPMLNRLHSNIYWTQRSNFIDIPTDCPQRDERLGWTGDAQVYIRTATLVNDAEAFFTKWLVDLTDGQRADGEFPMVAPVKVAGDDGGPAWAEAGVICPWTIYEVYGDKRLLERQYPSMVRFIDFCRQRSKPDLLPPAQYHCFGDWLSINADTPHDVIYTAYFARSAELMAQAAEVLGKPQDAERYRDMVSTLKASFNRAFVSPDGRIAGNTQACYVLALQFDLLDEATQKLAAEHLVDDIKSRGWHLSTGFIGTKDLMLVLSKIGRNDVAYRLIHQDTFPSWGFSIKQGATSIWERWNGWTPEQGFGDPGMNSFAHYSFGAVYQWMAENIGGIRTDGAAYDKIVIRPDPGGGLTWANTAYESIHGKIETRWKLDGEKLALDVTIPPNTSATVFVPATDAAAVTESGKPVKDVSGLRVLRSEGDRLVLSAEPGTYQFASTMKPMGGGD